MTEPAAESRIISIASYNHLTGAISIESGRGYSADNVVKPELAAPGVNVYGPRIGGGYTYRSGTSIAAAHAAGAAALLLTAVCTVGASFAAYADDVPSGPASDMELIQRREQASSSQNEAGDAQTAAGSENHAGAAEGQQTTENQETGNNGQTASETQGTEQGDSQIPDGMVASGGRYIDPNAPMVALTFDDGPYAPVGNRIMDCAEQYGGRVTFYVVGNRVNSYKSEIQRMYANGHEIGNHTQDHKYLQKLGAQEIRQQVEACNQAVAAITGEAPKTVRLPGGGKNSTVLANISQPIVLWNVDTLDWKTRNAASSVQTVLNQVKDGSVVLMHELYNASGDAAVTIIPALVERGYQLVTVSELAQFRGGLAGGTVYYSFHK